LNDGKKKAASGTGRVISRFNLYWDNDIAIHVGPGATRKSSVNDTVHGNRRFGYRVGCTCSATSKISIEKTLITGSGAYGVLVKSGGEARLSYASMSGNTVANTKGNVSKEPAGSVNGKPPGYISVSASSGNDFLRISPSSYQYTAGPGGMPIGARY